MTLPQGQFKTISADPPWRFRKRTAQGSPEHRGRFRYPTMKLDEIAAMPVAEIADEQSHLYLWVPNSLVPEGVEVMRAWGFTYKTSLVWLKTDQQGRPAWGMGSYFRTSTEMLLFGTRGGLQTSPEAARVRNVIVTPRLKHSEKPTVSYEIAERCSFGPRVELFARTPRVGWEQWGNQLGLPIPYRRRTWREIVRDALAALGGVAHVSEITERVVTSVYSANRNIDAKVRQQLQIGEEFRRVAWATWRLEDYPCPACPT